MNIYIFSSEGMNKQSFEHLFKNIQVPLEYKINIIMIGIHNNFSKNIIINKNMFNLFLCTEITTLEDTKYVKWFCDLIGYNRIYIGFECIGHPCHVQKNLDLQMNHFDLVFNSYYKVVDNIKFFWIPGYMWLLGYHPSTKLIDEFNHGCINLNKLNDKVKFMVNNPINGGNIGRNYLTVKFLEESIKHNKVFNFYGRESLILEYINKHNLKQYIYYPCSEELYCDSERDNLDLSVLSKKKQQIFTFYKFILVIENIPGIYVSEKLIDGILSNSVPIYFGQENIDKYFPDMFDNGVINGFNFFDKSSVEELKNLQHGMSLDNNISSIDNSISKILDKLNNMSDEEYNTRVNNIKNIRNKYIGMFHIGPVFEYCLYESFHKFFNFDININNEDKFFLEIKTINNRY